MPIQLEDNQGAMMATETTSDTREMRQKKFKERLLELGLLTEITPPLAPDAIPRDRQLISIEGRPISELIIEERR